MSLPWSLRFSVLLEARLTHFCFYPTLRRGVLPGRKSGFRAGSRPDSNLRNLKIGPPAGRRPAAGPIFMFSRSESDQNPARKADFRPGTTMAKHKAQESNLGGNSQVFETFGRPKAGRRADFGAFPVAVRPKPGPEGRSTARKHYCVT
jgi:hypothetical protein